MQAAHLNLDEAADAREKSSRVVIEPAQRKEYDRFSVSLCSQRTASLGFEASESSAMNSTFGSGSTLR